LSTEGDSGHRLATLSKVRAVTPKEFSVLVTAERLVNIEVGVAIRDGGPLAITGAVVDRQTEVLDPIFLEVGAIPEPPPDLAAEIVPDCVRAPGVDQVPVTGVQRELALLVQNGVTSGVSSDIVTTIQLLEARLGHISSKNFRHLGLISGFLQGVRKSSDPSERSFGREIFKENSALVGMARNTSLLRETIINFSLSYSPATHLFLFFSPGQNLAEARATRVVSRVVRILQVCFLV